MLEISGCSIILLVWWHFLSFSSNNAWFFTTINFSASYLASICSLDFLNALKGLSLDLSFSSTSPSNQFWAFPLTRLVFPCATLSMTVINFWKKSEYAQLTIFKIFSLENSFSSERFYKHQPGIFKWTECFLCTPPILILLIFLGNLFGNTC